MSKKPYIFQVATKPDKSSYKWIDKEYSILSTVILWFVWLCRFTSLYQHIKAIYRNIAEKHGRRKTQNKSGRPDIPPMMGEIYYILWTIFFVLGHIFGWQGLWVKILSVYYLTESVTWILYYTVFRRFFELGYSIYHKLEYLTTIALIIPTQALCFSRLYGTTFREMLSGLMGAGGDGTPFSVTILGCVFSAIVISMIISTFPMEEIKKKDQRPKIAIIGCGDVVQKRLLPAVKKSEKSQKVTCFDLETQPESQRLDGAEYLENTEAICRATRKYDLGWIATPPQYHLEYLTHFLENKKSLVVLEKPVAFSEEDLAAAQALLSDAENRKKVFCLSYYILEKALPLTYLATGKSCYEKYLEIDHRAPMRHWWALLGHVKSVAVHITEGEDNRPWAATPQAQKLETLIHNVLIAALFCGDPNSWENVSYTTGTTPEGALQLSLTATAGDATIDLSLQKNAPREQLRRYARIEMEGGTLLADLDSMTLEIFFKEPQKSRTIAVKDRFTQRYSVQVDLVDRVWNEHLTTQDVDGLPMQLEAIRFLNKLD